VPQRFYIHPQSLGGWQMVFLTSASLGVNSLIFGSSLTKTLTKTEERFLSAWRYCSCMFLLHWTHRKNLPPPHSLTSNLNPWHNSTPKTQLWQIIAP
jgi:hypothetical protein